MSFSSQAAYELSKDSLFKYCKPCFHFHAFFHVTFLSFLSLQLLAALLFFSHLSHSIICACAVALFCFTIFAYFVLRFFFQTKQSQQLIYIRTQYLSSHTSSSSLEQAQKAIDAAITLSQEEYTFYEKSFFLSGLSPLMSKCKIRLYWNSFFLMKKLLCSSAIQILYAHIQQNPTEPKAHALLSEVYFQYSLLHCPPHLPWIPSSYFSIDMEQKRHIFATRAVEECFITKEYEGDTAWVHIQLAKIYQLQEEAKKELEQYQYLQLIAPNRPEFLLRLGTLYFLCNQHAEGLKIYETLQSIAPSLAEQLLEHYCKDTSYL